MVGWLNWIESDWMNESIEWIHQVVELDVCHVCCWWQDDYLYEWGCVILWRCRLKIECGEWVSRVESYLESILFPNNLGGGIENEWGSSIILCRALIANNSAVTAKHIFEHTMTTKHILWQHEMQALHNSRSSNEHSYLTLNDDLLFDVIPGNEFSIDPSSPWWLVV